jgi:hypothetical protein
MDNTTFNSFKEGLLNLDPVYFIEKNLTLDGEPFRLNNGYKPFIDIYRYIGIKALEKDAKPVVLVKGRQVGATTMATALELYFMTSGLFGTAGRPPMRIMHCFPQLELAYAYTKTKLNSMIKTAIAADIKVKNGKIKTVIEAKLDKNEAANDSLHFKQFDGGNHIWVESTGLTADRIRGRTCDGMFFDEVQDMHDAALGNATKILAQSRYGKEGDGIQVYFGTPKQAGSAYYDIWMQSSQQYYHLGCESCSKYFPLYTPGTNEWESIWIEDKLDHNDPSHGFIVKCTHCGHEQDKRPAAERGKWIAANPDEDCKFVGFHINQLYIPRFKRSKIISEKPENSPVNTERAYQNEVLGEFYAGSSAPITPEILKQKCGVDRKFSRLISPSEGVKVYAGFDWGKKADLDQMTVGESEDGPRQMGQSYSCAVILKTEGPHILSIEFATKLQRNDQAHKKEVVEEMFRRYGVHLAVGDIGYAEDLTYILQQEMGDKFLASRAMSGSVKNHVKFVKDVFPKEIQFERNYYIAELYKVLEDGRIKFPYADFEKISWLVDHVCSMEIKVTKDTVGNIKQQYVKGRTPNDGFMALLNAYIAYKYDISGGFEINNPNQMKANPAERKPIPAIIGYIPKMR